MCSSRAGAWLPAAFVAPPLRPPVRGSSEYCATPALAAIKTAQTPPQRENTHVSHRPCNVFSLEAPSSPAPGQRSKHRLSKGVRSICMAAQPLRCCSSRALCLALLALLSASILVCEWSDCLKEVLQRRCPPLCPRALLHPAVHTEFEAQTLRLTACALSGPQNISVQTL